MAHLIPISCWRSWKEFCKVSYGEPYLITPSHLPFKETRIMQGAKKHLLILASCFHWNSSISCKLASPWTGCAMLLISVLKRMWARLQPSIILPSLCKARYPVFPCNLCCAEICANFLSARENVFVWLAECISMAETECHVRLKRSGV